MMDVLEHFTVVDGVNALTKAFQYAPVVLLATPIAFEQGEVNGNPFEAHLSEWSPQLLDANGFWFQDRGSDELSVTGLVRCPSR